MGRSDYNQNGNPTKNLARDVLYSDIPMGFSIHPVYDDIRPITDLAAIKQSVRNLVLTNNFEIPFRPDQGGNITALLFENADNFTASALRIEIEQVLRKFEPRIKNITVKVDDEPNRNAYNVTVNYTIRSNDNLGEAQFYLYRQR